MKRNDKLKKVEDEVSKTSASFQVIEKYAFFIGASVIWYIIVSQSLKWLQFPVHLHRMEVLGAYVIPIVMIYFVLKIVDWVILDPLPLQ